MILIVITIVFVLVMLIWGALCYASAYAEMHYEEYEYFDKNTDFDY